mmetsp:Transcript_7162/g.19957  ORF Transcript_7162/g.19957 Transcript_7162/m.19957 type:complete len:265 (+) Transcript_7162:1239-2033(+)
MVDSNMPTGLDGKATVVDGCPVVAIIVIALLPLPTIAEKPVGCGDGLPIAIAKLGSGMWSGGIVVRKVIVKATLSAGVVVSPAKLWISVVISEGKRNISTQCKLKRINLVISASHVAVRHFEVTCSTTEAVVTVREIFGVVNLKAATGIDGIVTAPRLEAATIVGGHHFIVYRASSRVALEPAVLASTAEVNNVGCGWIDLEVDVEDEAVGLNTDWDRAIHASPPSELRTAVIGLIERNTASVAEFAGPLQALASVWGNALSSV